MLAISTILHPTDFSEHAERAFELTCSLARDQGTRLIVLHATPPPVFASGGLVPPPSPRLTSWKSKPSCTGSGLRTASPSSTGWLRGTPYRPSSLRLRRPRAR
jgi:nucleotide-binding universal stress UspA family protein